MSETIKDKETQKEKLKEPNKFHVVLINDDFTPMEFVVAVLVQLFGMSTEKASAIMLDVHQKGEGIAGTFSRDIAETKAYQVCEAARQHEHPLRAVVKEA